MHLTEPQIKQIAELVADFWTYQATRPRCPGDPLIKELDVGDKFCLRGNIHDIALAKLETYLPEYPTAIKRGLGNYGRAAQGPQPWVLTWPCDELVACVVGAHVIPSMVLMPWGAETRLQCVSRWTLTVRDHLGGEPREVWAAT